MYQLVRSPPCCRPPGSAAPPSPSWGLKVTGGRKRGFCIKMMIMSCLSKVKDVSYGTSHKWHHLKCKNSENIPLQLHKIQTHTSAADLTHLQNTGREDVTELQLEKCQWWNIILPHITGWILQERSAAAQIKQKNRHRARLCFKYLLFYPHYHHFL